jgi:capsular polysaccharide biosynthesis protein
MSEQALNLLRSIQLRSSQIVRRIGSSQIVRRIGSLRIVRRIGSIVRRIGSLRIVRRRWILVGAVAALGLLIGAVYAVVNPPMLTSTALVVVPQAVVSPTEAAAGAVAGVTGDTGPAGYMATQAVIASSDPVLSSALPHVSPAMSLEALRSDIQVTSPTDGILSISANGRTAAQAEATANAVAHSYVAHVDSAASPVGLVSADILDVARTATGTAPGVHLLIFALLGAVCGAAIGFIAARVVRRTDRRLRSRDEIANSVGLPVLASLLVAHPVDAADWTKLLEDYQPGPRSAWRLRNALKELGVPGANEHNGHNGAGSSLAVLSLSTDPGAFALGPQLAVCAASLGIPTALVIGPQQDMDGTAALQTACAVPPPTSSKRPSNLRVSVSDSGHVVQQPGTTLTIVVAVVDGRAPQVADTMRTTTTVLGVSAGAATADQLARAALSAAADNREIAGILVADPEPTDSTTGRIAQQPPAAQHGRPVRLDRMTTPSS